jgi:hypothetical protein
MGFGREALRQRQVGKPAETRPIPRIIDWLALGTNVLRCLSQHAVRNWYAYCRCKIGSFVCRPATWSYLPVRHVRCHPRICFDRPK